MRLLQQGWFIQGQWYWHRWRCDLNWYLRPGSRELGLERMSSYGVRLGVLVQRRKRLNKHIKLSAAYAASSWNIQCAILDHTWKGGVTVSIVPALR